MRPDGNSLSQRCLFKIILVTLFLTVLFSILYFSAIQPPLQTIRRPNGYRSPGDNPSLQRPFHYGSQKATYSFDPHGNDTLVLIHIQKTGGTEFLRYLVTVKRNSHYLCNVSSKVKRSVEDSIHLRRQAGKLRTDKAGKKGGKKREIVNCPRNRSEVQGDQWLISEKTMRWVCGPHPSYTEYRSCLQELDSKRFNRSKNLQYAVLLRHPVLRYISEYLHVQRNATWASRHKCKGKYVPLRDMPPCYTGFYIKVPWPNLTLSKFLSCDSNWANNRQTLMLADLEVVDCFNKKSLTKEKREKMLLESAIKNLESFTFFGITEYMTESCRMFERRFGVEFPLWPEKRNLSDLHSTPMLPALWKNPTFLNKIREVNNLDMILYEHALKLFGERAGAMGMEINKNLVEEEIGFLKPNRQKVLAKYRKLNFTIS